MALSVKMDAASEARLRAMKQFGKDTASALAANRQKLMLLWSYSTQIGNLILRQSIKWSEGTKAQSYFQAALAGLQVAQSEAAVILTSQQAIAAFTAGNFVQGYALTAIATALQSTVIMNIVNQQQAKLLKAQAEAYRLAVEAYRA